MNIEINMLISINIAWNQLPWKYLLQMNFFWFYEVMTGLNVNKPEFFKWKLWHSIYMFFIILFLEECHYRCDLEILLVTTKWIPNGSMDIKEFHFEKRWHFQESKILFSMPTRRIKLLITIRRNYWNPEILSDIQNSELLFVVYMEAMKSYFYSSALILLLAIIIQQMTENPSDVLQLRFVLSDMIIDSKLYVLQRYYPV